MADFRGSLPPIQAHRCAHIFDDFFDALFTSGKRLQAFTHAREFMRCLHRKPDPNEVYIPPRRITYGGKPLPMKPINHKSNVSDPQESQTTLNNTKSNEVSVSNTASKFIVENTDRINNISNTQSTNDNIQSISSNTSTAPDHSVNGTNRSDINLNTYSNDQGINHATNISQSLSHNDCITPVNIMSPSNNSIDSSNTIINNSIDSSNTIINNSINLNNNNDINNGETNTYNSPTSYDNTNHTTNVMSNDSISNTINTNIMLSNSNDKNL